MRKNTHHKPETIEKIRQHNTGSGNPMFDRRHGPGTLGKISRSVKRTWKGAAFRKRWHEARWGSRIRENENVNPRNSA